MREIMANITQGKGKYGVCVKYAGGGMTTWFYEDRVTRDRNFKRIKKEVTKQDKVSKQDR